MENHATKTSAKSLSRGWTVFLYNTLNQLREHRTLTHDTLMDVAYAAPEFNAWVNHLLVNDTRSNVSSATIDALRDLVLPHWEALTSEERTAA